MILLMRHVVQHDETSAISGLYLRSKELGCGFVLILRTGQFGVRTTYTPWTSDRVVQGSDRAGFRMFSRKPSVCRGGNAVGVPPRALVFPVQGLVGS